MFDVLGLGEAEESAYRALVEVPSADVAALAARLGVRPGEAATALASLERRGLAARSSASPEHYVASPPSVALAALVVDRQEELRRAEVEIAALTEAYRRTESDRSVGDVVDVVYGAQAVAQRFMQLQASARSEVLGLTKAEVIAISGEENTAEEAAVERGVRFRVVLERAAFDRPGFAAAAEAALADGEEVRVAPEVPIRLLVVDRQIALVPLVSGESRAVGALLVHQSGLLDALMALFEKVWDEAVPLVLGTGGALAERPPSGLTALDARIFGLLLAGLTDQAIANLLDMSLRTVQRRVRALMDVAGADTRLQLGFQAAKRGWA
ncbi:helix-turn-helix domain-containing protein [Jiangella rhizosphaerae]|uniref:Helix-turn-helix transcriptional regulator n=1 Tax=Jiangella rhizosphaerae TaxID=2293569 RepID=A0A418KNW7_9ACTN|nr:helix-turn-helix domain-containing protein [Jiangella rhizosphaerae]RIQ20722.1 helix-turn-helix transcriptional regulator [Jiangella rhizosphaerae]